MDRALSDHIWDSSGRIDSTGSANAYVIEVAEPIAAYHRGMTPIRFRANFGNTGSATANIVTPNAPAGLGAVTMKKNGGAANLATGDIASGGVYTLIHDGTNFQVLELNAPEGSVSDGTSAGLKWNFDSSTAMADPGSGDFRLNNATLSGVTAAAVSDLTGETGNPDASAWVLAWDDSTNSVRGTLVIKTFGAEQNFAIYNITGASTDNSGWTQLALTYVSHNGSFVDTDACVLNFSRAGNVGAPGVDGAETSVNIQVFTSSDTYTPTVGMNYCIAEAQAPSGGGGGADRSTGAQPAAAAGGGGGEYRRGVFSAAEIGAGVTVTINAPGTAGNANGGNGGNGGTVTFGALMTANGGSGGLGTGQPASGVASYLPGGAGGTGGSGGQLAIPGGQGGMGVNVSSGQWIAGNGGWSMLGGVTTPNHNSSDAVGTTGKNYGSGGSGAVSADGTGSIGGVGGPGCAIITEYIA